MGNVIILDGGRWYRSEKGKLGMEKGVDSQKTKERERKHPSKRDSAGCTTEREATKERPN